MIINGKYILRQGQRGDKPASGFLGTVTSSGIKNVPDYVLLHETQQIGAVHLLGPNSIYFIEIFESNTEKGHGTKFVELLEREVKRLGHCRIEAFPVTDDRFEHILRDKRGWTLIQDEKGDKKYLKDL